MEKVQKLLLEFSIKTKELESLGGPEKSGPLFEEILNIQDHILKKFGLPSSHKYCQILWNYTNHHQNKKSLERCIETLKSVAADYLFGPPQEKVEILIEATLQKEEPENLFPELGYPVHDYFIFLYIAFLQRGYATPEKILEEFDTVHRNNLYKAITEVGMPGMNYCSSAYSLLSEKGLQFINPYILYKAEESDHTAEETNRYIEDTDCIENHIGSAAMHFDQYLKLRTDNVDEITARNKTGLNSDTFFKFALYAHKIFLQSADFDYEEMRTYVFSRAKFLIMVKEFEDIELGFRRMWNANSGNILGDADFKNAVYQYLEAIDHLIRQDKVDDIVDLILEYLESIGRWGE